MKKRILITGGAGFIGSSLALKLDVNDYEISIMDNLSQQIHGSNPDDSYTYRRIKDRFKFFYGDVRNIDDWKKAIQNIDIVVHLAAETGTGQSMYEIDKYIETNVLGTSHLFELIRNHPNTIEKVVIASSRSVYGEGKYSCDIHGEVYPENRIESHMSNKDFNVKCPICGSEVKVISTDENSILHPTSVYGFTKLIQEQMGKLMSLSTSLPIVSLRFQNVYGPGQSLKNPYTGILSIFSNLLKNNKIINVYEDGLESRDFVFIDDVIDAIINVISKVSHSDIYNIGSGTPTSVITVANTLKTHYQSNSEIVVSGNYRIGDIRANFANLSKAKRELGFSPKVSFDKGISEFIKWVNEQQFSDINYDKSVDELREKGLFK